MDSTYLTATLVTILAAVECVAFWPVSQSASQYLSRYVVNFLLGAPAPIKTNLDPKQNPTAEETASKLDPSDSQAVLRFRSQEYKTAKAQLMKLSAQEQFAQWARARRRSDKAIDEYREAKTRHAKSTIISTSSVTVLSLVLAFALRFVMYYIVMLFAPSHAAFPVPLPVLQSSPRWFIWVLGFGAGSDRLTADGTPCVSAYIWYYLVSILIRRALAIVWPDTSSLKAQPVFSIPQTDLSLDLPDL
ncbi:hypothetical protein H696_03816 [Fonticula alba]|uniref:Guided entry of tail-anchored proteins 1 n=1 Tax=Fonticula alba TaxID=691883 RepID=A0A058Z545_FONAL|nr:hypothetical protein H696_03816 [Fonticula alba]KCV69385.1 hypothetical protein H696_03816 [Fonticula alba]|eukprot:XP_009495950.1 hypothetical protein H696_03816 [Fonticula alba]